MKSLLRTQSRVGVSVFAGLAIAASPLVTTILAQSQSFEVASLKPGDSNSRRVGIHTQAGGRFNTENTPLRLLIQFAYNLNDYQIAGGPSWIGSAPYTIEAKPETAIPMTTEGFDRVRLMLQSLLGDRFKLVTHWETREGSVYELVIAKGGPKLHETDIDYRGSDLTGPSGQLTGKGVPMSQLVGSLARQLGRPIVDKTGLSGRYNFTLQYSPESRDSVFGRPSSSDSTSSPDPNETIIFTALQEQLGLRLESAKGSIQTLVIDHAEKPSLN